MTPQEVFDIVVGHLRKQGCKSIGKFGGCKYLTDDGKMCAIGCLIKSDEYSPKMEGHVLFDLISMHMECVPDSLKERLAPHKSLLNHFMRVHDFVAVELWESAFQGIAKELSLTYTAPEVKS
jgi:hypothetical protein